MDMTVVIRILTFALPVVIVIATLEGLLLAVVMRRNYNWRAYFASLADALGRQYVVLTFLSLSLAAPAYDLAYGSPSVHDTNRYGCRGGCAPCRPGFLLLLVPSLQPPDSVVLGDPCRPSFLKRPQFCCGLPLWVDRAADRDCDLLRAARLARFRAARGGHRQRAQPALPILAAHGMDSEAWLARICPEHALSSSRAPRGQSRIPRPQLWWGVHHLGPHLRDLRCRTRRSAVPLWPCGAASLQRSHLHRVS